MVRKRGADLEKLVATQLEKAVDQLRSAVDVASQWSDVQRQAAEKDLGGIPEEVLFTDKDPTLDHPDYAAALTRFGPVAAALKAAEDALENWIERSDDGGLELGVRQPEAGDR